MRFAVNTKVSPIEDHAYLQVTKADVGKVAGGNSRGVEVRFKNRAGTVIFQADELKRIKREKKNAVQKR